MTEPESMEQLAIRLCEEFAAKLNEHFDASQLFVSWNENGMTYCIKRGAGNWYSRQGMAHEFINEDVAQENAKQLAEQMPQPVNDDDEEEEA